MDYLDRVISCSVRPLWRAAVAVVLGLSVAISFAAPKAIRLRNEVISTEKHAAAKSGVDRPHSGLFLIQLTAPLQAAWTAELERRGITLVRYVPDDAFIARSRGTRLKDLEQLPFVQWTGRFRPEHKVHGRIKDQQRGNDDLSVSILLAPDALPQELVSARGLLKAIASESSGRFGHVWRGVIPAARVATLASSEAVLWVEPTPVIKLFDETASKIVGGDSGAHPTYVQSLGYDGSGVVVAVADSGLHVGEAEGMHPDLAGRVDAFLFYGQLTDAADEHSHGTHVAGIIAGNGATGEIDDFGALWGLGVAPGAHVVAQRIFDGEGNYEAPPSFEALTRDAVRAGADIGSNSWGDDTQGRYDISAAEFDALVRDADALTPGDQPYILEFSAGNAGPGAQTVGSPAVAKNVIATGASQNNRGDYFIYADGQEAMADFSSRGPAEDGRIKPDVVAPGTWIASLRSPLGNDDFAWGGISDQYLFQGGTSQAGPHVSGAAAVFVQYYRQTHTNATPSPALVKAALINSAVDMDDDVETGPVPNADEGWGRIDLVELIDSYRGYEFIDQAVSLATGQQYEHRVVVADSSEPLRVTLAYTDVPGFPGSIPALVNDLDLEVIAPNGAVYHGNQFEEGESIPEVAAFDSINNVEAVHISEPVVGDYIIRIRARNVAQDARVDSAAVDQDFALTVSALIPEPGTGVVLLDRPAYTAPSRINVKVIDRDLGAQPAVAVAISSRTEPATIALNLQYAGIVGTYTGSVATASGGASQDAALQIAHGDWIRVEYLDASASALRTATATADLLPPVISGVETTNEFGQAVIVWNTDEPANSVLRFDTNAALTRVITRNALVTEHEIELMDLPAGQTYQFSVSSTDAAGNSSTDDNGGALFSFVAPSAATVLLVDAYTSDPDSPFIPTSAYTDALTETGVSFDVLPVADASESPTLSRLRPYQAVIWRINDSIYSGDTLSASQQGVIQQYLSGGGAFFMASMEILSRVGAVPFRSNVFHVARFDPNENPFEPCVDCDEDHGVPEVEGAENDPVSHGMFVTLDYSQYPEIEFLGLGPDFADTFGQTDDATPILFETGTGRAAAMRYPRTGQDSTGRVVFASFPLDTLPATGGAPNTRSSFLRNVLSFLVPGQGGSGTIAVDRSHYTIPDLVTIEVADADLAGAGQCTVNCSSDSAASPVTVTLSETTRRGLFRGFISTAPLSSAAGAGTLRTSNGESIRVEYFDESAQGTVATTALIDTVAPVISNRDLVPDYEDATVTWDTSEESDALVEFGPSVLLGRTAYSAELDVTHELRITGLLPEQQYYYRIVSRDPAGNVAVDDNNGQLYTFTTLTPVRPPFADHFDAGGGSWSVFTGEDSQSAWTLGVPNNGWETEAASPPNAWGSSLNGENLDTIDTFLISPAINLVGGNSAHVRFVHSYDFSEKGEFDLLEGGELLLFTNSVAQPITLAVYEDVSAGWEEEDIDLSPYLGHVIYLVWHHQLFSFDAAPRAGWLLDDVSISAETIVPGTITVTNNLSQAGFAISGPLNITGQGMSLVVTNAPPGDYAISFNAVPFYNTPPPQTQSLAANQTIAFTGNYTVTDTNANGIADTWEQQYLGAVAPSPALLDSDGDGASDYAEFAAGTNPTNQTSYLHFLTPAVQTTGAVRLDWPTVPGRSYRITGSADLQNWSGLSDWMRANGGLLSYTTTATSGVRFFKVEVRP